MFITKYFQVINLTMPSSWVALLAAFVVAYVLVRMTCGKETANVMGDAMFYFIIIWKLSVIVTDFKIVVQFPLSILYFNGGTIGVYLGVLAAGLYVAIRLKKKRMTHVQTFGLFIGSLISLSMYQVFMALFNDGAVLIRVGTILVFLLFVFIIVVFINQFKDMTKELVLLAIGLHLFMSVLQPAGIFQTSTIVMIIIGGLTLLVMNKRKYILEVKA